MKKSFGKIFLVLFVLGFIFSNDLFADETNQKSYKINEYDLLKSIDYSVFPSYMKIQDSREDLISSYKEKIYDLKNNWTEQELKNVGYRVDQIFAIKNFDGSEDMLRRSATEVTVNIDFTDVVIDDESRKEKTNAKLIADFYCEGIQSNWFDDIFAVAWSNPLTIKSKTGSLKYTNRYGEDKYYYNLTPKNDGDIYGLKLVFSKYKNGSPAYYISGGSMVIELKSNTVVYDMAALASYGYSSLSISPSFTISKDGLSISISFSSGVKKIAEEYASY